jgi:hypothetical protein
LVTVSPLQAASSSTSKRISAIDITLSAIAHPLVGDRLRRQLEGVTDVSGT